MDSTGRARIDPINREAEREKAPDDPQVADARDAKPLIVMIAAALAATTLVLGIMWMNGLRYDGATPRTVAEQQSPGR